MSRCLFSIPQSRFGSKTATSSLRSQNIRLKYTAVVPQHRFVSVVASASPISIKHQTTTNRTFHSISAKSESSLQVLSSPTTTIDQHRNFALSGKHMSLSSLAEPRFSTKDGIIPFLSETSLRFHYYKLLTKHIKRANHILAGTQFMDMNIEEAIIRSSHSDEGSQLIVCNHLSDIYNHMFFFDSLISNGIPLPKDLELAIGVHFESFDNMRNIFQITAKSIFGAGFVWLVESEEGLEVMATIGAENPLWAKHNKRPLLCCDMWEHSYMFDYGLDIDTYLDNFWLAVNWTVVKERAQMTKGLWGEFFGLREDVKEQAIKTTKNFFRDRDLELEQKTREAMEQVRKRFAEENNK